MGHLRLPELKQAVQFLAPEFGPVRNSSTTGLPGQFGQHSNQQDLSQGILKSPPLSTILDLSQGVVQSVQVKEEGLIGKFEGR